MDTTQPDAQPLIEGFGQNWLKSAGVFCLRTSACVLSVLFTAFICMQIVALGFRSPESLGVLFVIPVLLAAILWGYGFSFLTVALAVIAYNFVLLAPVWHVDFYEPENVVKLLALGFVAFLASALSSRLRQMAMDALQRERILSGVYALSQSMLGISNLADMRKGAESKLSELLDSPVGIVLHDEAERLDEAARFCIANETPAGGGSPHFSSCPTAYLPLTANKEAMGVISIDARVLERASYNVLATLAAQTASALEKAQLAEVYHQKLREQEKQRFFSAMLSSVSHDFKTPLVTILGALATVDELAEIKQSPDAHRIVKTGYEQAQRLHRFINNLLEISRIEAGLERIAKEHTAVHDLLSNTFKSLREQIGQQTFTIHAPADLPLLIVNPGLIELVLINVLENALKYGPTDGEIKVIAAMDDDHLVIDVDDDGPGIPQAAREAVFKKFHRLNRGDAKIAGTGLGLYICRAIIESHGGKILVIDPHDGIGACLRIQFPPSALVQIKINEEVEDY